MKSASFVPPRKDGTKKGAAEASALEESGPNAEEERPHFLGDQPNG